MNRIKFFIVFQLTFLAPYASFTQSIDSLKVKKKFYQTTAFKTSIIPALLIGYGISTINDNGIYSSYDARDDIQRTFKFRTEIDDYLIFAPYVELAALNLLKIRCQNDFINTALLILKSEVLMLSSTFIVKSLTKIERPDGSDFLSFPSGHTAQAFVAASIVNKEFKYKSPWYGVGAYTIAVSVGAFRMINNKHWQSDVFAGAGFGMLSAHIAYWTHRYRWGQKLCMIPYYQNNSSGLIISLKL